MTGVQTCALRSVPFTGPDGELYVAWNDYAANTIAFSVSLDGGASFGPSSVVSAKTLAFEAAIPAEFSRHSLVYPACDADRTTGPHRGRLYCSWMDAGPLGTAILMAASDDRGASWSATRTVGDRLNFAVDRFNQWLSVDPVTADVVVAFYDTRNDSTGLRYGTDVYVARSRDGGASFAPDLRASSASSNEHDCDGVFPCSAINYGNQQGDYAGVASFGGVVHPFWVDSRSQQAVLPGCRVGAMEEVFTTSIK